MENKELGNRIIGYIVLCFSILFVFILIGLGLASNDTDYKSNSTRNLDLHDFILESPNGNTTEFVEIKNKNFDELVNYFEEQGYEDVITYTEDENSEDKINIFNSVQLVDEDDNGNEYCSIKQILRDIEINRHSGYSFYNDARNKEIDISILRNDDSDIYLIIAYSKLNNTMGIKPIVGTSQKERNLYRLFDKWKSPKKYKIRNYDYTETWDGDIGILSINSESDLFIDYDYKDGLVDLELYDKNGQNTNILYYVNDRKVSYE